MITVDADGLCIVLIICCVLFSFAGYVIGCMETTEKYEKETK